MLVLERLWYFGSAGPVAPPELRLVTARRGHKVIDSASWSWLGAPRGELPSPAGVAPGSCSEIGDRQLAGGCTARSC